jgi:hypothetical protein
MSEGRSRQPYRLSSVLQLNLCILVVALHILRLDSGSSVNKFVVWMSVLVLHTAFPCTAEDVTAFANKLFE